MIVPLPHASDPSDSALRPGLFAWLGRIDFARPKLGAVVVILGAAAFWMGVILKMLF
jgi:hypothetical protein